MHLGRCKKNVTLLHDVVYDGASAVWSFDQLRSEGFVEAAIAALKSVTKRLGATTRPSYCAPKGNACGREAKLADIADNMDMRDIPASSAKDLARDAKDRQAKLVLESD